MTEFKKEIWALIKKMYRTKIIYFVDACGSVITGNTTRGGYLGRGDLSIGDFILMGIGRDSFCWVTFDLLRVPAEGQT